MKTIHSKDPLFNTVYALTGLEDYTQSFPNGSSYTEPVIEIPYGQSLLSISRDGWRGWPKFGIIRDPKGVFYRWKMETELGPGVDLGIHFYNRDTVVSRFELSEVSFKELPEELQSVLKNGFWFQKRREIQSESEYWKKQLEKIRPEHLTLTVEEMERKTRTITQWPLSNMRFTENWEYIAPDGKETGKFKTFTNNPD